MRLGQRSWWLRQAARVCFLLGSVSLISLLLLAKCGVHDLPLPTPDQQIRAEESVLREEIRRLKEEITDLRQTVRLLTEPTVGNGTVCFRKQEVSEVPASNEYEVTAYSHFTAHRIYPTELGLGKRVVEKPIGAKRRDLRQIVEVALAEVNRNRSKLLTEEELVEGIYRSEPAAGGQYEVYFKEGGGYTRVGVRRWAGPAMVIGPAVRLSARSAVVHVILTSTSALHSFLDKFYRIGLKVDRRVALSVVKGKVPTGRLPSSVRFVNSTASALVTPWPGVLPSDHVVLMLDSRTVFSARFLERCRWNAGHALSVYYPIPFALYNPHLVYSMQGKKIPPESDQLLISRETGFWKDISYSVSCQYKSDFVRAGGLETGDDLAVYRRHLRSGVKVIRATDPGLFQLWHPKECKRKGVSEETFKSCVRSRALHEGTHAHLGLLIAFNNISTFRRTS